MTPVECVVLIPTLHFINTREYVKQISSQSWFI